MPDVLGFTALTHRGGGWSSQSDAVVRLIDGRTVEARRLVYDAVVHCGSWQMSHHGRQQAHICFRRKIRKPWVFG